MNILQINLSMKKIEDLKNQVNKRSKEEKNMLHKNSFANRFLVIICCRQNLFVSAHSHNSLGLPYHPTIS